GVRHEHGEFESAPALRRAAHSRRRRQREARRQPAPRVRAQDGHDGKPAPRRSRHVRDSQGFTGRQHRQAGEVVTVRLRGDASMKRGVFALAALMLGTSAIARAAGKSDVADAVMNGDRVTLRTLIQQNADVSAPQIDGATALHWAVYRDDLESADLLIAAGAKVDAANRQGFTPLVMAALYGNAPMIERLLKARADAKQRLANGETTVMLAARNGNPQSIKLLPRPGLHSHPPTHPP